MSQKPARRQVTEREWLATVISVAVCLPAGFFFVWYVSGSWSQALMCTSISAWVAQAEWERRYVAPDRNVQLRGSIPAAPRSGPTAKRSGDALRTADRLHLSPRHRAQLVALLREHLPDVDVWARGSRVTGKSHDGSDLDLVLRAPGLRKIPIGRLDELWEALRESTVPFRVEAYDWARLPERFHGEIKRNYVVPIEATERRDRDGPA